MIRLFDGSFLPESMLLFLELFLEPPVGLADHPEALESVLEIVNTWFRTEKNTSPYVRSPNSPHLQKQRALIRFGQLQANFPLVHWI